MRRLSPASRLATVLLLAAASTACGASTPPPETQENAEKQEGAAKADKPAAADTDAPKDTAPPDDAKAAAPAAVREGPKVDKSMSLDTYEMTPSDCEALGQHYGEVERSDQMSALSPKLSEKQRAGVAAQVDKVVGKMQQTWTDGCHASLENKAVDHDALKCALDAKTVKAFDVCLNGPGDTTRPEAQKSGKKK